MSQDYRVPIDNDIPVSAIVSELNPTFEAVQSNFAGTSDPSNTVRGQIWFREDFQGNVGRDGVYYYKDQNDNKLPWDQYINISISTPFIHADTDFPRVEQTFEKIDLNTGKEEYKMSTSDGKVTTQEGGRFIFDASIIIQNESNSYNDVEAQVRNVTSGTVYSQAKSRQTLINVSGTRQTVNLRSSIYLQKNDEIQLEMKSSPNDSKITDVNNVTLRKISGGINE